jgi:predicted PurR-regulated permease PerM
MGNGRPARRFFFLLLIAAAVLFAYVVQPIASALFLGATLAGVLWPAHQRLSAWLRGRRSLAALLFVVGLVLLVVGPTVAFSTVAIAEGTRSLKSAISSPACPTRCSSPA